MLQSLHVRNLALLEETEVQFGKGLNILTGETGAGKSLLIGSVNLALGAKFEKEMLRKGADSALVELIFASRDKKVLQKMEEMDLIPEEDGTIIISRRLQPGKSICKINGETVTTRQVKELAEVLIDIHGQHEHQSLLHKKKHLEILDAFCGEAYHKPQSKVEELYHRYKELKNKLDEESMDEESKQKEQSLAEFELKEIEDARLSVGEDEELESDYRRMVNSRKIMENLTECYQYTGSDSEIGAGGAVSRAVRALRTVTAYDENLAPMEQQLGDIESLLSDFNRDIAEYMSDSEFSEEEFQEVEGRLNLINRLKEKYGNTIQDILDYASSRQEMLDKLTDYDAYMMKLRNEAAECERALNTACEELSNVRRRNGEILEKKLTEALKSLNFLTVQFEIAVRPGQTITALGYDEVEFLISTNPGETVKPLGQVASGGELSRVMLAIKTVLAEKDAVDTLIFDEIDAGISGKTAWKVSEQLASVSGAHQVICITHLPQIAAMADTHFVIEKSSTADNTITDIRCIKNDESVEELARLLGSDTLTEAALSNAREMQQQALKFKTE
ncbi:MAG: DNA repair protein RecN [Acetatifactor sp.]|nr:DNA repair protein RecN [Acetatifactor sp.]